MVSNQYWTAISLSSLKWQITTQAILSQTIENFTGQHYSVSENPCHLHMHTVTWPLQVLSEKADYKHLVKMSVSNTFDGSSTFVSAKATVKFKLLSGEFVDLGSIPKGLMDKYDSTKT